jgi:hypothetical protein
MSTAYTLFDELAREGFTVAVNNGNVRVMPASRLTKVQREHICAHKAELLAILCGTQPPASDPAVDAAARPPLGTVVISGKPLTYIRRWSDEGLQPADGHLVIDTETELIPDDPAAPPPRLALASVSDGETHALIHPDDLGRFLLAHRGLRFVCHNAAFDFWVIEEHLRRRGEEEARRAWWAVADDGRLHDTMLLDGLVRLAKDDTFPKFRSLDIVAREHADLDVDKSDPYRLRYAEIIGRDWSTVEDGFFTYAIADAIVTHPVHAELRRRASTLACRHTGKDVWDDAGQRFGLLTETLQVRKAIALAAIKRAGMAVDLDWARRHESDLRQRLGVAVAAVREQCPDLYKIDRTGRPQTTRTGAPSRSDKVLRARLATIKGEIETANPGVSLRIPPTPKRREPKTSTEIWGEYKEYHPFLADWIAAEELAKLLQFFAHLQADRVHPSYTTFVRTGRTSSSSPNVQQIPRDGALRQAFVPSPGYYLLAADYSVIELRVLAAVCLRRYGRSALAEVIRAGVDPHAHTAAMMLGVSPGEFLNWKNDPAKAGEFKKARQAAKPVNFGVPGGLGAESLARYARRTYEGVEMTTEDARERRQRLIGEIYPELSDYLAEDAHATLADTLHTTIEVARLELGDVHLSCVRKILEGEPKRADGVPYNARFVERVWTGLNRANKNPELTDDLQKRNTSRELARKVTQAGVATLTGRIRGRVRYSQARNTPFQGLAADGAALALFALVKEGFRVVGFVHDEVLVELPDEGGFVSKAVVEHVEKIMTAEMEKVLGGLPASVESTLSTRWSKEAKHTVEGDKVLPWSPKESPPPLPAKRDGLANNGMVATPPKPSSLPISPPAPAILSPAVLDVLGRRTSWACVRGDCLDVLASLPLDAVSLVFGSPPYVGARLYLEDSRDLGIARDVGAWVAWMVRVYRACLRVCTGLVAFVVEGQTKDFSYDAAPILLAAELSRAGICLRKPPIYRRVGIPGSGSTDWLRNDYELIICATHGGRLPWADNKACGKPPKYKPGGAMSYRTVTGERCNAGKGRGTRGKSDGDLRTAEGYKQPKLANPGNVIDCKVGGGRMGSKLAHENEAPFPEELAEFFVKSFCPPGGIVLDPFAGSGTTLAVALHHGRRALGVDLRKSQVDLTRRRVAAEVAKGDAP